MRTKHEITKVLTEGQNSPDIVKALQWVLGTCEACKGKNATCKHCGREEMCSCDGTSHKLGIGCS